MRMKNLESILLPQIEDRRPLIIAGPCSAENEIQVLETAQKLKTQGVKIFRAGVWKPRTKPGSFEGHGVKALPWIKKVKDELGMYISTEVANHEHIKIAIDAGFDLLWIGARTCANPFAMQEIADTLKSLNTDIPILIKNPINPDLELWIGGIQRIYNAGIRKLGAIHRGFSVYGQHTYRNQPQWHIPLELHRRFPNLPILHDPSHTGGKQELIAPLCQQAMDMGFDGLIIECHNNPQNALSDNEQQLTPQMFDDLMSSLIIRDSMSTSENLSALRSQIDDIDDELMQLLAKRMSVCREIGQHKKENRMPVVQNNRYQQLISSRISQAQNIGLGKDFIKTILESIHEESVRQQIEVINKQKH